MNAAWLDCHCITCSDEGIPMRVQGRDAAGLALCAGDDGARASVLTDLVEPVADGDLLLVHAGVALARLNRDGLGGAAPAPEPGS